MCGVKARTNFPYNSNESNSAANSSKLLSDALKAKLQKCNLQSFQIINNNNNSKHTVSSHVARCPGATSAKGSGVGTRGVAWPEEISCEWPGETSSSSPSSSNNDDYNNDNNLKPLEDDHIEQMIEELLDYGYVEICPADHTTYINYN